MKVTIHFCLVLIFSFILSGCSSRDEFVPKGMGPLEPFLLTGSQDGWSGALADGVYTIENAAEPGAIKYFYTGTDDAQVGSREISVFVDTSLAEPEARAGLLYGYQSSPRGYYAFVVGNGMFDVFKRDDSGFTKTLSSSFEGSGDGFERITLREDGSSVSVSVNGREVSSLGSSRMGKGSVGIVVVGAGTFKFANYSEGGEDRIGTETTASNEREANRDLGPAQRFKDQAVYDVSRKNLPAYHVLVPEGWKLEGKFEHIPAFKELPYFGSIEVKAPDGRSFSFLPFAEFTYTDYAQLGFMQPYEGRPAFRQPSSVGEVIKVLAQSDPEQRISDMRIISEETVPELTQLAQRNASATIQQVQAANQRSGGVGERQSYAVEARKIVVQYTENGKRVESTTFATVSNYSYIDFNGATRIAKWNLNNVASLVGPVGSNYLEGPELAAVARSLRINPDWAYAIDQWYAGRRQIIFKEGMAKAAAASRNWQNTRATQSEDVLDISFNGWKSRNASSDRTQSMSVNSIHERTTYGTPSGGSINLPSYYQNAYTDGQGNYILHNDALYNLNTDPNLNARDWTQIEPVR